MSTFRIASPEGSEILIPAVPDEACDPYRSLTSGAKIKSYYDEHGYVVIRGVIPPELCDEARVAFAQEVKPFRGYIYRQASATPEINKFSEHGYVLNSILNVQDLNRSQFPRFRECAVSVVTHRALHELFNVVLGEPGKVVQTMYFEGNPETWAHQDTYYLDSVEIGRMAGAWIAMEDIHPGAGRFYVYPDSHLIDMEKNGGDFDIAFNHSRYKQLVLEVVKGHGLECRAPALRKGDVLFWSSRTIHGSLQTTCGEYSRASFTAHAIPGSKGFLQYQSRRKLLRLQQMNGVPVHCPKDQNRKVSQAVMLLETAFPTLFNAVKRAAIKLVTY